MSEISLSKGIRSNLLSLQDTAGMRDRTQNRLATGRRVNNALDNPTNFFTSATLTSRAADIGNLLDSIGNSVQTINAASSGIAAMTKIVETMQATARQATQSAGSTARLLGLTPKTGTATTPTAATVTGAGGFTNAGTVAAAAAGSVTVTIGTGTQAVSFDVAVAAAATPATVLASINAAAATAGFGTVATGPGPIVLNEPGGQTITVTNTLGNANDTATEVGFAAGNRVSTNGVPATLTNPVDQKLTNDTILSSAGMGFAAGDKISIQTGPGRFTRITISATTTVGDLINLINDNTDNTGTTVVNKLTAGHGTPTIGASGAAKTRASLTADGRLLIENTSTEPLVFSSSNPSALGSMGFGAGNSSQPAGTINATRRNLVPQFNELRKQIDQLATDSGYNGVNLLNGDSLQVMFNERQTSVMTITGVRLSTDKDLPIGAGQHDFQTDKDVQDHLSELQVALSKLRSTASTFGSNLSVVQVRQKFTGEIINTLKTGADNLTLADINEESANMLSLQTRQQLSTQALSLANQADQGVLRLFGG